MNVLFIGNSFTFFNEMPMLFSEILQTEGVSVNAERIAYGGHRLRQYVDLDTEKGKITWEKLNEKNWDYVILQGHSAEAALEEEHFLQAVRTLCKKIREVGAEPVLYQTWSYQNDSEKLKSTEMSYEDFYKRVKDGYEKAAKENCVPIVPVGDVFLSLNRPIGDLEMICHDGYHPTLLGSYAAAVCFACTLLNSKQEVCWHPDEVSKVDASRIWSTARAVLAEKNTSNP